MLERNLIETILVVFVIVDFLSFCNKFIKASDFVFLFF